MKIQTTHTVSLKHLFCWTLFLDRKVRKHKKEGKVANLIFYLIQIVYSKCAEFFPKHDSAIIFLKEQLLRIKFPKHLWRTVLISSYWIEE